MTLALTNKHWTFTSDVNKDFCDQMIDRFKDSVLLDNAPIGGTTEDKGQGKVIKETRDVFSLNIYDATIENLCEHYIRVANSHAGWELDVSTFETVQFLKYMKDGHYMAHQDGASCSLAKRKYLENTIHSNLVGTVRKLSLVLFLNDDFEGGEFILHQLQVVKPTENEKEKLRYVQHEIPIDKGTVVIFPAGTFHEVRPVTKGERYSVVQWAGGPPIK